MNESKLSRRSFITALGAAILCFGRGAPSSGASMPETRKPFSIVALPDTQLYAESYPDIFLSQTRWIKDNKDEMNIVFVVHEGDITDDNSEEQWRNADKAMTILDGVVPYCLAVGNHDMGPGGSAENRDTHLFNKFFPVSRFEKQPWYRGHYGDSNDNSYCFFTASGMKFLLLVLEFGPRDVVLDWANQIVSQHKDRRVIVLTHCYMCWDETRVGEGDSYSPHDYGCRGNDGEEIWEKFVRKHKNVFLVLSGHIVEDGLGRLTSTGDHGNKIHQILANYQMKENGGNGWLRIMKFAPQEDKIYVTTYSPFLKKYATDEQNQFQLHYDMR